jgi:hypothetical protein
VGYLVVDFLAVSLGRGWISVKFRGPQLQESSETLATMPIHIGKLLEMTSRRDAA